MPTRTSLIVAVAVVLVLAMGVGARQLIAQQKSINGLRAQITALRGPAVVGKPLTLYSVEGDASGAEQDAQDALSQINTAPTQPSIDPNAGAVATLQSQVMCLENDLQELADYQQQGENTTLWFSTCP